ncbi:hypothetical protein [Ferrimonas marina]|uniref:Uncharacterized protein n=1 Tax=Ferrimonas marina TaxID=299255 RepID=A0A1M5XCX9_9GAMM|nr:hypothetical protein [Ferrimonas marina]SHH97671.1 hypothetical protein SAMN02745129_3444 [Ferrimonas marina]
MEVQERTPQWAQNKSVGKGVRPAMTRPSLASMAAFPSQPAPSWQLTLSDSSEGYELSLQQEIDQQLAHWG